MIGPRFDDVRIYHQARSAHLERAKFLTPATMIFNGRRYDFDSTLAADLDLIQAPLAQLIGILARFPIRTMEINEPLMRAGIGRTALAVAVARVAGVVRRRRPTIVSYAIENRHPFGGRRPTSVKSRVRFELERFLCWWVAGQVDRIAYGTAAARELYTDVYRSRLQKSASTLIPALPTRCGCAEVADRDRHRVLFVGTFDARKGIPELLAAWPEVRARIPDARLTLIGKGPLSDLVNDFASARPEVDVVVDPPREAIHQAMRRSAVLVLLSQPQPLWREQVGLPIVEGLSHGCSILTTTETGLADWLVAHGHSATPAGASAAVTGTQIAAQLASGRSAESVLADLPAADGRILADHWMFATNGAEPVESQPSAV